MSSLASSFFAASARSVPFRELLRVPAIPRSICNIMDADAFEEAVTADLQDAQTDSSDLVTAIQDAATSTTFDAVPTSSAVTLGAIIRVTRPPTFSPSPRPSSDWIVAWEDATQRIDIDHYIVASVTTVVVAGFSVFCYYTHPSKDKVGLVNLPLPVWAWLDFGEWWVKALASGMVVYTGRAGYAHGW